MGQRLVMLINQKKQTRPHIDIDFDSFIRYIVEFVSEYVIEDKFNPVSKKKKKINLIAKIG